MYLYLDNVIEQYGRERWSSPFFFIAIFSFPVIILYTSYITLYISILLYFIHCVDVDARLIVITGSTNNTLLYCWWYVAIINALNINLIFKNLNLAHPNKIYSTSVYTSSEVRAYVYFDLSANIDRRNYEEQILCETSKTNYHFLRPSASINRKFPL